MARSTVLLLTISLALVLAILERGSAIADTLWVLKFVPVGVAAWYVGWGWASAVGLLAVGVADILPAASTGWSSIGEAGSEIALRAVLLTGFALAVRFGRARAVVAREAVRLDLSTGLANARALFESVNQEVERAKRYGRPFTLAYLTVENLEALRLRSGRAGAEEVLRRVALHIRGSLRGVDLAARLRDREFALLLPETDAAAAQAVLARLDRSLASSLSDEPCAVGFCIGAITWVKSDLPVKTLHQRTYQLMYSARKAGIRLEHEVLATEAAEPMKVLHLSVSH